MDTSKCSKKSNYKKSNLLLPSKVRSVFVCGDVIVLLTALPLLLSVTIMAIVVLPTNTNSDRTSFNQDSSDDCVNPLGRYGTCVDLIHCPALFQILKQSPVSNEALKFLQRSTCGFRSGQNPRVCCVNARTPSQSSSPASSNPLSVEFDNRKPNIPETLLEEEDEGNNPEPSIKTLRLIPSNRTMTLYKQIQNHPNLGLLPSDRICGLVNSFERIVGGEKTGLGAYPWIVLIGILDPDQEIQFACGGTLITKKYVLTASHCVAKLPIGFKLQVVRVGEYDQTQEIDCSEDSEICAPKFQDIEVEQVIPHEQYDKDRKKEHDIALLRLKKDVSYGTFVSPICLPLKEQQVDNIKANNLTRLLVAGWGRTLSNTEDGSAVLQHVSLPLVPNDQCNQFYTRRLGGKEIGPRRFCAGGEKNKDSCKGDSGGPLQGSLIVRKNQNRIFQFGIVSLGPPRCGGESEPGLYTKVAYYIPWILDHIKP